MSDDDGLFRHNRPFDQLDGFYTEWCKHLTERRLPRLLIFSSVARNDAILRDLTSYYDTLNHYANKDTILYLLLPSWRSNSLETPILFLGDINPRLLTTLIQSFIDDDQINQDPIGTFSDLAASWEDLSSELGNTINGTITRLLGEIREAQEGFITRFTDKWVSSFLPSQSETVVMETSSSVTKEEEEEDGGGAMMIMEELVRIYREANQLRKDTITSIVGVLDKDQTALFLDSVCKILAGFKQQDHAFQNSLFGDQLPNDDHELLQPSAPPGEAINNAHQNHPQPMMMQQHDAPPRPPPNHHLFGAPSGFVFPRQIYHPHMMPPPLPPGFYQVFPLSAPPVMVFARPPMMQPFPPQRPPPPMNQQHQQHPPEVQNHVIYVGNLAPEATNKLLFERFRCYYHSARLAKTCFDARSGSTYGFVSFTDERDKTDAMREMNQQIFLGRPMSIGHAAKNSI